MGAQVAGAARFEIGGVRVYPVAEIPGLLVEPTEFFPQLADVTLSGGDEWYLRPPFIDPIRDRIVLVIQAFLVVTSARVMLVDACVGDGKSRRRPDFDHRSDDWLDRLRSTGVEPGQVDTVVLTHLHVDHVGWATRLVGGRWAPTFPNARYLVTEADYRYWSSHTGRLAMRRTGDYLADSVEPLLAAGVLDFAQPDARLDENLRLMPAPGETPGHVCVEISHSGKRAILAADTLHHPLQCAFPDWSTRYAVDPVAASQSRRSCLESVADTDVAIIPTHFPPPSIGRINRDGPGYRFEYAGELVRADVRSSAG